MILRIIFLLTIIGSTGLVTADDSCYFQIDDFSRYLGLAIPVPAKIPELKIHDMLAYPVPVGQYKAELLVDKKGKVEKVSYPEDSEFVYKPLLEKYKDIRFNFLDGSKIANKIIVPIKLKIEKKNGLQKSLKLIFPVSSDMVSDTVLLNSFWEINDVEPPSLQTIMPIFYRVTVQDPPDKYQTITALISLDENGKILDIRYPLESQKDNNHYVHVALMRARFNPGRLGNNTIPCEFLTTFRIFNNLNYPLDIMAEPDTTRPVPITRKYFYLIYYNERDIYMPALPHENPYGYLPGGNKNNQDLGVLNIGVTINEKGRLIRCAGPHVLTQSGKMASHLLRVMSWYPAVNHCGESVRFTGKMTLNFNKGSRIVYSPDWLEF